VVSLLTHQITPFFSSLFVGEIEVPDKTEFDLYKLKESDAGRTISVINGWQSTRLTKEEAWSKPLLSQIIPDVQDLFLKFGIKRQVSLTNYWVNISPKGALNISHTHPQSCISACVYIKASNNCGNFVLERPDNLLDFVVPDTVNENNYGVWEEIPKKGKVVYFSSNLPHSVLPNMSDEDRISVAFNFR